MENRTIKFESRKNKKISIKVIPGHFATNHSHINNYIDMTEIKCKHLMAREAGKTMAEKYISTTPVDAIICMDGCEIIAGFLAAELADSGIMYMNSNNDISVIVPEFNSSGQMILRDNIQPMVWNKNIVLLVASATTGKTINRFLECIKYYGGKIQGISAIFSAIDEMAGVPVDAIFKGKDIPNYETYGFKDCPYCREQQKLDAIVNGYGYSKL